MKTVKKMKYRKAGGESGILLEMLKAACHEESFVECLLELIHNVWREPTVPSDCCDAVLVPLLKKGDLSRCDNWRGISLLDMVGKVVVRILQDRLQKLGEDELPLSQCSFRKGRSCMNMIFSVRRLLEKSLEHRAKLVFSFIDLGKAYDSVPSAVMWLELEKVKSPYTDC